MSLDRSLWSIQMWSLVSTWIASPVPLDAVTLEMLRLRMMTLVTPFMDRPMPVSPEPAPTPMMVLFEATVTLPEPANRPDTRIVSAGAAGRLRGELRSARSP